MVFNPHTYIIALTALHRLNHVTVSGVQGFLETSQAPASYSLGARGTELCLYGSALSLMHHLCQFSTGARYEVHI